MISSDELVLRVDTVIDAGDFAGDFVCADRIGDALHLERALHLGNNAVFHQTIGLVGDENTAQISVRL